MSKYQRSLTARFRLGVLSIAIETGQFTHTPLNEINSFYCVNEIEDELQFVNGNYIHIIVKNCLNQCQNPVQIFKICLKRKSL